MVSGQKRKDLFEIEEAQGNAGSCRKKGRRGARGRTFPRAQTALRGLSMKIQRCRELYAKYIKSQRRPRESMAWRIHCPTRVRCAGTTITLGPKKSGGAWGGRCEKVGCFSPSDGGDDY